jgi:hypothetical protein
MRTFTGMTVAAALPRLCIAILIATAGCKSKALQERDGSGGGIDAGGVGVGDGGRADGGGAMDGGGWIDGAGVVDRPGLDVPFAGRRSFVVTAEVFTGGTTSVTSHVFTMTLYPDQRTAVIGVAGGGQTRSVEETAAGLRLVDTVGFGVPVSAPCGGSLRYDGFDFAIDASGGLLGSGRGVLATYDGIGVPQEVSATMILRGVPDAEPPILALSASGDLVDPWSSLWVVASEPLPEQQMLPVLRSTSGDLLTLDAHHTADPFVAVFAKPLRLLRFGEEYRLTFEGITDLAGNAPRPSAPPTFTTRPAPPLIAGDGFESITGDTLGGAQVLSGAGAPVIAGARSLYIPPAASLGSPTQLAVRLSITPGQRFVRFDYRIVNPTETYISWIVAGVAGEIETATPPSEVGVPTTPATIDGTQVSLGPTRNAELLLRPDARGEVVVARIAAQGGRCGGPPPPPVSGAIIDNLRTE